MLGFFFWLDLLSTVSLIFDIGWISDGIFGTSAENAQNAAQLARASRASKVGSRAGRIVRLVRLIRLVKLYKSAHQVLLENTKIDDFENDGFNSKSFARRDSNRLSAKINKTILSNNLQPDNNGYIN